MASNEVYTIPPIISSEFCYAPSAPMQSILPPSYSVSTAAAPPPISYTSIASPSGPIYPTAPMLIRPVQMQYPGVVITGNLIPPQTANIRDYMVWSIINLFLGGCLLGTIAIFLSKKTRKRKQEGDVEGARTLSNITLTCNILITIIFCATTAFSIIYFVIILSSSLDELRK